MKIVALDGYSVNPGDLSWSSLEQLGEFHSFDRTKSEETIERCRDAEAVLTNKVVIGKKEIAALPQLRYIGVLATGYNIVDVEEAHKHGIIVTNIPAYSTASVVQIVFAHLLNITNRTAHYAEEIREGKWTACPDFTFWDTPLIELQGKTMGIFGLGHIGMTVAKVAMALGMTVIALTSKTADQLPEGITPVNKEKLFSTCDVLTIHAPLTPSTKGFVSKESLALMKPTAIVINTSRGPLVDEQALADALNEGRIFAAAADVISAEPSKADNPLLTAKNCYLTPHIGWATFEARTRLIQIATDNVKAFLNGSPINVVS